MRNPKDVIKETAFSVGYNRDADWLVLPDDPDPFSKIDYHSDNINRYLAVSDIALLRYDVAEHSDPDKKTIMLEFKRGSLVVFDGQNHFIFYYPDDLVNQ